MTFGRYGPTWHTTCPPCKQSKFSRVSCIFFQPKGFCENHPSQHLSRCLAEIGAFWQCHRAKNCGPQRRKSDCLQCDYWHRRALVFAPWLRSYLRRGDRMSKIDDKSEIDTTFMTCIIAITIVSWIVALSAIFWLHEFVSLFWNIAWAH